MQYTIIILLLLFFVLAIVEVEITVQSISFPGAKNLPNIQQYDTNETDLYLNTMFLFYKKIMDNFHSLLTKLQDFLYEAYGCVSIDPRLQGTLILRIHYRLDRVVRLQCDQSSGALSQQIQNILVTPEILQTLSVDDMRLTTDIQPFHTD